MGPFNPAKPVRDTGKSSLKQSWIINWSCSIFFLPLLSLLPLKGHCSLCLSSLRSQREGRMVELHRGIGRLFIPPSWGDPLQHPYIRLAGRWLSRVCRIQLRVLEPLRSFQDKKCVRVCFKSLSPGHLSYLCHITRCPIRARQKGPVSARLTTWIERWKEHGGDGWTGGEATSHPTSCSLARFSWDFNIDLSCLFSLWLAKRGRQVRLSMCVFNNGSNRERRRRAGRGTDESRGRAKKVWKSLLEMTTTPYLHLCTSWWFAFVFLSLHVLHTNTMGGQCGAQCSLNHQTAYIQTSREIDIKCMSCLETF